MIETDSEFDAGTSPNGLQEVGPDNLTDEERANVREIADEYSRETIKLLDERGFSLDDRCCGVLAANMRLLSECICSRQRTIWQMRLTTERGIAEGLSRRLSKIFDYALGYERGGDHDSARAE